MLFEPAQATARLPCFTASLFQLGDRQETVFVSRLKPAHLYPTLCLLSLPREAGVLFLNLSLLSLKNFPSFLHGLLFKCPSNVLYLLLDHCGLGNFLLAFQISSWNEIFFFWGGEPCRNLEFGWLETATSLYICCMRVINNRLCEFVY
jgi:hypothetical protein